MHRGQDRRKGRFTSYRHRERKTGRSRKRQRRNTRAAPAWRITSASGPHLPLRWRKARPSARHAREVPTFRRPRRCTRPPHNRGRPLRWDRELQPAESPGGGRGDFAGGTPEHGGGERGTAEPGLGGGHDGLPAWMDEVRAGWTDGTWEAGIPRIATGVPDRKKRLTCLGNAVVPAQFYPVFQAIADIERMRQP